MVGGVGVKSQVGPSGNVEFKIHWQGFSEQEATWEPWYHFFPGYNEVVTKYCGRKGVPLDLARLAK